MATAKRLTKGQIMSEISGKTGLAKKDVSAVFEGLRDLVKRELGKRGPGEFVIPDLLKLRVRMIPGRKAGMYQNPFTKEMERRDAKPPQKKVRAVPLKKLKDLVR